MAREKAANGKSAKVKAAELLAQIGNQPSPIDEETRKTRLKTLIKLGKERGFLTYAEVNDHLPDDVVDAEQIESIISTFNDMGIQVYDEAPDAETLLMSETSPTAAADDADVEEQAEQALSTVDSEFGRTTDPVGRALDARRRNRNRQTHRRWPEAHDPGHFRLPHDHCRAHRQR